MEQRLDSNLILNQFINGTPITVRYDSNVLLNMLYNGSASLNANIIGSPVIPGLTVTGLTSMGDVTINGSLFINGPIISAQTQDLIVSANTITLNDGETGAGVTEGYAGIIIDRGTLADYYFIFDEPTQSFKIGEWATLQKVATREDNPINYSVAYWDNTENIFKTGVLYSDPDWTSVYMSGCTANGEKGFAVGDETIAGTGAAAFGYQTQAIGAFSLAEGTQTIADGQSSHAEGISSRSSGIYSHAEGNNTLASGIFSHSEGDQSQATGSTSHSEGYVTIAGGEDSHSEGRFTIAYGDVSHAEGNLSIANGHAAHAEGQNTIADGLGSHSEGNQSQATGSTSHAEGYVTIASGNYGSHAEGSSTTASGNYGSHSEGYKTIASGIYGSHAEGSSTTAYGQSSHAEGIGTAANGDASHAQNYSTVASGDYSDAGGYYNEAVGYYSATVGGQYNKANANNVVVLGGSGIIGSTPNTVYVEKFNIKDITGVATTPIGIDAQGNVVAYSNIDSNTYVTGATLNGYDLILTRNDGQEITLDLFTIDSYLSGGTYNAGNINFVGHNNSFTVDVSALLDDTNTYVTGSTLSNYILTLTRNDGVEIITDLAPISFTGDLATNLVLEHTTASNLHGIIYKDTVPFIHNFNYGDNGTVTTVGNNLFIGEGAGNFTMGATATQNSYSSYNIGIGSEALKKNANGFQNTAIGNRALYKNTDGYENIAIGRSAMNANTIGYLNTAVGTRSMMNNQTGQDNTAYGAHAMMYSTGGLSNVAIGGSSLLYCNGNHNTAIGNGSLQRLNAGSKNVGVGYLAGQKYGSGDGTSLSSVNNSIYIGYDSRAKEESISNEIVIGYQAIGNGSNTVTIGNTDITNTYLRGTTQSPTFSGETIEAVTQLIMTDVVDATRYSVVISAGTFVMTSL